MVYKVDFSKASKKREEEKIRSAMSGSFIRFPRWVPKAGTNKIRIMPPWTDQEPNGCQFWREVWMHWGVTAKDMPDEDNAFSLACPVCTPKSWFFMGCEEKDLICPICDFVAELRSTGSPVDVQRSKEIKAKMRVMSNIIDVFDPVWKKADVEELIGNGWKTEDLPKVGFPKIQVFSYGSQIMLQILDVYQDKLDITDLVNGRNLVIEKSGKDINTSYRVRIEIENKPAPIDKKFFKIIDKLLYNLDEIVTFYSVAQMTAILEGATFEEIKALPLMTLEPSKQLDGKKETSAKSLPSKGKIGKKATPIESESEEVEDEMSTFEEAEEEFLSEENSPNAEDLAALGIEDESEIEAEELPKEPEKKTKSPKGVGRPKAAEKPAEKPAKKFPPLDEEGNIDFEKLTNEEIEDPANEVYVVNEQSPYVPCYGKAMQYDEAEEGCQECGLFERCGERVKSLKEPASVTKKKPGRPPTAAKGGNGQQKAKASSVLDIEEEMRRALNQE